MAFADKPVKSIKAEHVEKILSKYAAGEVDGYGPFKPKSNNTLLRMKAVLSSILVYGINKNYLNKNGTEKVRIKAEPN